MKMARAGSLVPPMRMMVMINWEKLGSGLLAGRLFVGRVAEVSQLATSYHHLQQHQLNTRSACTLSVHESCTKYTYIVEPMPAHLLSMLLLICNCSCALSGLASELITVDIPH